MHMLESTCETKFFEGIFLMSHCPTLQTFGEIKLEVGIDRISRLAPSPV